MLSDIATKGFLQLKKQVERKNPLNKNFKQK